jgi:hypothetical protein
VGLDFDNEEEALAAYANPLAYGAGMADLRSSAYVELTRVVEVNADGVDVVERLQIRKNPDHRPTRDDQAAWRREAAMQAGMAFGCDGYNDVMD